MLLASCVSKPFNVIPRSAPPGESFAALAPGGPLEIQASAIRDEDYLYSTFDANLVMAGLLPVKVSLHNNNNVPIDLAPMRFLLGSSGQKPIEPRRAFKRLVKYYGVRVYSPEGYKLALADFSAYGLDQRSPLPPGESRWGLLFFEDRAAQPAGSGLAITVKGGPAAELKINVN